ncbi:polyprenyl synthetase family protein [Streptomyces sp. 130]|uniref:polyprenyl synthetase family protein n=1 Tax=Streptomyces sp. 130 TaxID=2591006 RepID=UPI00117F5288|nr:polyprenyl synthetase family protein [Streptomyces sp. 130]TRV78302.1 polyprenyl synthetase family protein [Streptomyces sp. 130]
MLNLGPFNAGMLDKQLVAGLTTGMAAVDKALLAATETVYRPVTETSRYLLDAGGKRFRPALSLLAAQYGDPGAPGVVPTAAACELTHLATLHHDDVMDEARLRRGVPSANSRWGNTVSILTGDFLFSKASQILAGFGPEAVMIQTVTFERLVTGQIRETLGPGEDDDPLKHYFDVIVDKTGSLIATSARFGALMSGADRGIVSDLTEFGENIGVAFQLADDILDITSESDQSGKTPGTDLREGVATLPVLYLRADAGPRDARLLELLDGGVTNDDRHAEALALMRGHRALDRARQDCTDYADRARMLLKRLPAGPATDALNILCDLAVHRAR